jgi:hypothetical protein
MFTRKINFRPGRSIGISIILAGALMLAFTAVVGAHEGECETKDCRAALVRAKQATARFHDYNVALASGYSPTGPCVALPTGEAMGFHHTKFSLVDLNTDETEPEVLIYLPDDDGVMQLVGLEYVVPFIGSNPAPTLFAGQVFEGPNQIPFPSYALHVWVWRNNPWGTFADFNPKLRCPQ